MPGDHLRSIARSLGLPLSTARYHLSILERDRLVRVSRLASKCRHFPVTSASTAHIYDPLEVVWHDLEMRTRVEEALRSIGSGGPSRIAQLVGASRQLVTYHLLRLAREGKADHGPGYGWVAGPAGPIARSRLGPTVMDRAPHVD